VDGRNKSGHDGMCGSTSTGIGISSSRVRRVDAASPKGRRRGSARAGSMRLRLGLVVRIRKANGDARAYTRRSYHPALRSHRHHDSVALFAGSSLACAIACHASRWIRVSSRALFNSTRLSSARLIRYRSSASVTCTVARRTAGTVAVPLGAAPAALGAGNEYTCANSVGSISWPAVFLTAC
jgi:hypothetical protein